MPGPIDYLRQAYNAATTPLVPKSWVDPVADAIDSPSLERRPWQANVEGFEAGALEGLRGLTSPVSLASFAVPALRAARLGRGIIGAGEAAGEAMGAARAPAGAFAPELTAVGDEGVYNAMRPTAPASDTFYNEMLRKLGGRGMQ